MQDMLLRRAVLRALTILICGGISLSLGGAQSLADIQPGTGSARVASWPVKVEANVENDLTCLAQAIYFEARGEPLDGQAAVAEVILNRVDNPRFPDTICNVVYQGASNGTRSCQFSFACDGHAETIRNASAWKRARALARAMLEGRGKSVTKSAIYFHALYVAPSWARKMVHTVTIGNHVFYREPDRTAQR